ncbi:hypothetical protein ACWD6R_30310 [Streptomyces sp. NPDC005151]
MKTGRTGDHEQSRGFCAVVPDFGEHPGAELNAEAGEAEVHPMPGAGCFDQRA